VERRWHPRQIQAAKDEIVVRVAAGEQVETIIRKSIMNPPNRMPLYGITVYDWRAEDDSFSDRLTRAEKAAATIYAFRSLKIAETTRRRRDNTAPDVAAAKLASDRYMQLAEYYDPDRFGKRESVQVLETAKNSVAGLSDDQRARAFALALGVAAKASKKEKPLIIEHREYTSADP